MLLARRTRKRNRCLGVCWTTSAGQVSKVLAHTDNAMTTYATGKDADAGLSANTTEPRSDAPCLIRSANDHRPPHHPHTTPSRFRLFAASRAQPEPLHAGHRARHVEHRLLEPAVALTTHAVDARHIQDECSMRFQIFLALLLDGMPRRKLCRRVGGKGYEGSRGRRRWSMEKISAALFECD